MTMNNNKRGVVFMLAGFCLIVFASGLTVYNLYSEYNAGSEAQRTLRAMADGDFDETADEVVFYMPQESYETESYVDSEQDIVPLYLLYPDMEMPVKAIEGREYIGSLYISDLGLELPVLSELTYPGLRVAPCRYKGTAYKNNMIIAAHNYKTHFGNIKNLKQGSVIRFVDSDNNDFKYSVQTIETLAGTAVEEMENGGWDLTLFTCNYGGSARITVRCSLI